MPRVNRDVRVATYLTPPNAHLLEQMADQEGLSMSELLRSIVSLYLRQVREDSEGNSGQEGTSTTTMSAPTV